MAKQKPLAMSFKYPQIRSESKTINIKVWWNSGLKKLVIHPHQVQLSKFLFGLPSLLLPPWQWIINASSHATKDKVCVFCVYICQILLFATSRNPIYFCCAISHNHRFYGSPTFLGVSPVIALRSDVELWSEKYL